VAGGWWPVAGRILQTDVILTEREGSMHDAYREAGNDPPRTYQASGVSSGSSWRAANRPMTTLRNIQIARA